MKGLCLILALFILVCDCGIETYADAWDGRSETTLYRGKRGNLRNVKVNEMFVPDGKVVPKKIEYTMMEK